MVEWWSTPTSFWSDLLARIVQVELGSGIWVGLHVYLRHCCASALWLWHGPTTRVLRLPLLPLRPAKTKPRLAPVPPRSSSEILDMILSPDAATRVAARRYSLRGQIPRDLMNPDTDVQNQAVRTLEKVSLHQLSDPAGLRIISDEPSWCRRNLKPAVARRLIELKQYDLIRDMAAMALSDGRDSAGIDDAQAALAKMLLACGKFDPAVPAAKTYYNVCSLGQTSSATSLMAQALLNGPGQKDPGIVQRFKAQQDAGADPRR